MTHPPHPPQPDQPYGQPPPPQQQYPQRQPAPQGPPGSALRFTVQGNIITTNMIPPTLTIDGFPAPTTIGSTTVPIQPGNHHLEVYSQWMRRYGQASLDVQIPPNSLVEVFYAAPVYQFTTGNIGLTKQKRKGLPVLLAILIGVPVLVILIIVISALLS